MDDQALQRWGKLLDSYFNAPSMSEEWRIKVRRLFASEIFTEEKFAALEKYFDMAVRYDPDPDEEIETQLNEIRAELGFPEPEPPN